MNKRHINFERALATVILFSVLCTFGGFETLIAFAQTAGSTSTNQVVLPQGFTFQNNMKPGQTWSPDVSYLKRFLNNDPRTKLNNLNPCISTDVSTDTSNYYDARTKDAVMRFQNLFQTEILQPAGLVFGTGLFGQLTRTKVNQLLNTPAYANIRATSTNALSGSTTSNTLPNTLSGAVTNTYNDPLINEYLTALTGTLAQVQATTTTSTTTLGLLYPGNVSSNTLGTSSDPLINAYYNYLDRMFGNLSNTNSTSTTNTGSTTVYTQPTTSGTYNQLATTSEPIVNSYYSYISRIISGEIKLTADSAPALPYAPQPAPNVTSAEYLNDVILTLYGSGVTTATEAYLSVQPTAPFPILLGVAPTYITDCDQQITITGQRFATTSNILFGSIGSQSVNRVRVYSQQLGMTVDTLTFTLRQFSNYYDYQKTYAGTTQNIAIHLSSNNLSPEESAVIQFVVPGQRVIQNPVNSDGGTIPTSATPGATPGSPTTPVTPPTTTVTPVYTQSSNTGPTGILKTMESTEKTVFTHTPQGYLIKTIGGDQAVNFAYSISPTGHINQKLQGKLPGLVNPTGGPGNGTGPGGIIGAVALITGAALLGGGANTGALVGFGGPITDTFYCDCTSNWLITLNDRKTKSSIQLIYQDGASRLRSGYMIYVPGVQTLGLYRPGGSCQYYVYPSCIPGGAPIGTIHDVGTSYR